MPIEEILGRIIVNIAFLLILANLLSHLRFFQRIFLKERRSFKEDLLLSLIFFGIIVISSEFRIDIGAYVTNTRVIGAMSAGLLGGPLVGFISSVFGSLYVLFRVEPFGFAQAAAFSTLCFGLLGAGFYPYFQRGNWKYRDLLLLGVFAEFFEMFALMRQWITLDISMDIILESCLPMILINSVGLVAFVGSFNYVYIHQDAEVSRRMRQLSTLANDLLPLFRNDREALENMKTFADYFLESYHLSGIMITDADSVLTWHAEDIDLKLEDIKDLPIIASECMEKGELIIMEKTYEESIWAEALKDNYSAAVPLLMLDRPYGSLIIWAKKKWFNQTYELESLQFIRLMLSFYLSIHELEKQQRLRDEAELRALQFQVNPHFLFNALNTIAFVCRKDGEEARSLLHILASYFRYNLERTSGVTSFGSEMEHVRDYLKIEQARFEEKLQVRYELSADMNYRIPLLIIQPIVENAVRYGINQKGYRSITIRSRNLTETETEGGRTGIEVSVADEGPGFPEEVLSNVRRNETMEGHVGVTNVNRRLQSLYGEGLHIQSSERGSRVTMRFYMMEEERGKEAADEDRNRG